MEPPPSKLKHSYEKKSEREGGGNTTTSTKKNKKSVRWGEPEKPRTGLHISFSDNVEIINPEEAVGESRRETEIATAENADFTMGEGTSSHDGGNVVRVNFGIIKEKYTYVEDFLCPQPPGPGPIRVRGDAGAESGRVTITPVSGEEVASRQMQTPAGWVWMRATVCSPSSGVLEDSFQVEGSGCVIVVSGKVMGSGRGTPSLRDGVHCVGFNYSLKTDFEDEDENNINDDADDDDDDD